MSLAVEIISQNVIFLIKKVKILENNACQTVTFSI